MSEYRLAVQIGVEPDKKWVSEPNDYSSLWVPQYLHAAGTFVEVEGVGELVLNAEGLQQQANQGWDRRGEDWTWGPATWGIEATPDASGRWTLPVSGRPIVLLAVGGGNQVFHHWEGVEGCRDQGARCELAEPAGHDEAEFLDVYVKAVFVKGPWADATHLQPLEDGQINPRIQRPRPPR